ncbi:hypothetical protein [Vibrio owensii]|uniref:hypothetical protein n=1 Tax=Vibrio owensii TaxID=696485 RepID=UPI0018F1976F|nr:hypothetical protein [Vibrio owensii]
MSELIGKNVLVVKLKHVTSKGLVSRSQAVYLVEDKDTMSSVWLESTAREFDPEGFNPGKYEMISHMPVYDWQMPYGETCNCILEEFEVRKWYMSTEVVADITAEQLLKRVRTGPVSDFNAKSKQALIEHIERVSSLL